MSSIRKTEDAAKSLSKIALEPSKRQELWNVIEQRIDMDISKNDVTTSVPKRRNRSSWGQLSAAVVALVLITSGITYGAHYEGLKATRSTGNTNIISIPTPKSTIQLTLTLPNGQTVKPGQTADWKDLSLSLIITSLPPANASSQIFGVIMGDGTNRISQETVSTSIGSGELWYTQRKDSTYAYYAIVKGNQNVYVLQAVVTGNPSNAKSEVTSLLDSLHVSDTVSSDSLAGESQYSNAKFGFTVNIPESWKNEYTIRSISPQGGEALQSITFDYFKEKGQPFLLSLVVYPKDYLPHLTQDPQVLKAFSNDEYSFAFYKENEYPDPKDANYSEFKSLESEIPWIVSHFVVRPSNPLFDTTLPLPDGQVVKSDSRTVRWKDLTLSLRETSLPPASSGMDGYLSIVGNHATIISHENVSTSAGLATLVYFQRTPPAAASGAGTTLTNEFYVISYGRQYAYVIQATITGDVSTAKSELMSLLQGWKVPSQAPTIPSPNAELTQWRYDSGIGQQISQTLYGKSFNAFYLPVFITKGDSFVGTESNNSVVTVDFKDMTLIQSPKSITPSGTVAKSTVVTVPNLMSKVTIYTMADKSLTLSIHEPTGTYVLLSSASIPLSELEAIVVNMTPLNG